MLALEPSSLIPGNFHITGEDGESLAIVKKADNGYQISDGYPDDSARFRSADEAFFAFCEANGYDPLSVLD